MIRPLLGRLALVALIVPLIFVADRGDDASAVSGALFDPSNIISDAAFFDGGAMSASEVQTFLDQKVTNCTPGYTCLKDYRLSTPALPADAYCGAYTGGANLRASDVIAGVGASCGISQKVILVLLQKEQSLVTLTNPSASRFDHATGFACPDSAACDATYGSFFYQVYYAARQYQRYAATPTRYNYQAGRYNNILFHPNSACGTSSVYIANQATAGLYNYTPYQPNAAALANLYGTGDSCSSYGNRNFWRLYSDWFGSPTVGTSLVRTTANATVYLVSGESKYPIGSLDLLAALAPLGSVGFVSQAYVDNFTTRQLVGRAIRDEGGSIYFFDRGTKLPFQSCTQAEDYGYSCGAGGYVQLTNAQANAFATGPTLSSVLGTTAGERYYISRGTKSEILDEASQTAVGLPATINVLTPEAIGNLALVAPIVRQDVFLNTRGTGEYSLLTGGKRYAVQASVAASIGLPAHSSGSLSVASVAFLPASAGTFNGAATDASGATVVLTTSGRYGITAGGLTAAPGAIRLPDAVLNGYPVVGNIGAGSFIKSATSASVYVVMPDDIRPISGWQALLALTPDDKPQIMTVDASLVDAFAHGPVALTAGTLVRSPEHATVYLVDGVTSRIALSSFIFATEAGFSEFTFSSQDRIDAYPLATQLMTFGFACQERKYVAARGSLHEVSPALAPAYPMNYVPLDPFTCQRAKFGTPATSFIRVPNGTIFYLADGSKHPITSMARYFELGGAAGWTDASDQLAAVFPTGANA